MADYNFLLGAQVPQIDPLGIAGKALTLGDLATRNQMMQFQLSTQQQLAQAMSDPEYWQAFQNIMSGQGTPGDLGTVAQKYPNAAQMLQQNVLGLVEKQSQIAKNQQEAAKLSSDVQQAGLSVLGNTAYNALKNPTMDNLQSVMRQIQHLDEANKLPPSAYTNFPDFSDASKVFPWLQQLGYLKQDPKTQTDIQNTQFQQWAKQAEINHAYLGLNPPEQKVDETTGQLRTIYRYGTPSGPQPPTPPGWVADQYQQPQTQQQGPAVSGPMDLGQMTPDQLRNLAADRERVAAQGPNAPVGPPVAGPPPQGAPGPKVDYSFAEKQDIQTAQKEIEDTRAKALAAGQLKTLIQDQRQLDGDGGIFTGAVQGQEFFKKVANILAPYMSKDDYNTLSNSQAWDANINQIIAQSVKQFAGARVAAREIPFFAKSKVDPTMTDRGRELTYNEMWSVADRMEQLMSQMDNFKSPIAGRAGLTGFQPKYTQNQMPPIMIQAPNGQSYPAKDIEAARQIKAAYQSPLLPQQKQQFNPQFPDVPQ